MYKWYIILPPNLGFEAASIRDEPIEEAVFEVAQECPPRAEMLVVSLDEGYNGFDWNFGNASKSKKG